MLLVQHIQIDIYPSRIVKGVFCFNTKENSMGPNGSVCIKTSCWHSVE